METTYLDAICEAMSEEMARDERVFLIGEDVGAYGGAVCRRPRIHPSFPGSFTDSPTSHDATYPAAYDAKGLLKAAIRDDDPVLFIEHKYLYRRIKEDLPSDDYIVPIGKANVRRRGKDLTIITWSAMIYVAEEAADALAKDGVSVEILDLRSIIPFDEEAILESVAKTNRVVILHEAP